MDGVDFSDKQSYKCTQLSGHTKSLIWKFSRGNFKYEPRSVMFLDLCQVWCEL